MPMTSGSAMLQDFVADTDATVVARLLDEGAEIVALLNLEDLSFSGGGDTSTFGPVFESAQSRASRQRLFGPGRGRPCITTT